MSKYLDLHVLQTVPSNNLNRDDTGAPKTAIYGGVTRARVSSQAWKHAMRENFQTESTGYRTNKIYDLLTNAIKEKDGTLTDKEISTKATDLLKAAGIKLKDHETSALFFVSPQQIDKLAEYSLTHAKYDKTETAELKRIFNNYNSLDLALFGRMLADDASLNVDAASQVAHAISTHEIQPEFDYFTAVDDCQSAEETGATMLGSTSYNSSTLYRYANINLTELVKNLNQQDAINGTKEFIKQFVLSMPTGKQNSFANKTLPTYIIAIVRDDTPVNLVSAFETPITTHAGYMDASIKALDNELENVNMLTDKPLLITKINRNDANSKTLTDLITDVTNTLTGVI